MPPISLSCPYCQEPLSAPRGKEARALHCPACDERVLVPNRGMETAWECEGTQEDGPVSFAELRRRAADGRLRAEDRVRPSDTTDWTAAEAVVGLFPGANSASAAPSRPQRSTRGPWSPAGVLLLMSLLAVGAVGSGALFAYVWFARYHSAEARDAELAHQLEPHPAPPVAVPPTRPPVATPSPVAAVPAPTPPRPTPPPKETFQPAAAAPPEQARKFFGVPFLMLDSGGHSARVTRAAFTPDGRRLITASFDKTVRIWDLTSGETVRVLRVPGRYGNDGRIIDLAISPDGKRVAAAGVTLGRGELGNLVYVFELETGRVERVLKGHTRGIHSVAFAPDGKRLASGSFDNSIRIYDLASGRAEQVLEGHEAVVRRLAFSPDGTQLASVSQDQTGRLWLLATGQSQAVLRPAWSSVAWSPDGNTVAIGNQDGTVALWGRDGKLQKTLTGLRLSMWSVTFTPDGREVLCTGAYEGPGGQVDVAARLVNVATGKQRVRFTQHDNSISSAAISPDGKLAATCGGERQQVYIWSTADGTLRQDLTGKGRIVRGVGWSPDGKTIGWVGRNNQGRTFHLEELAFDVPTDGPFRGAVHNRGKRSLVLGPPTPPHGSRDLFIQEGGQTVHTFRPESRPGTLDSVLSFSWLPDGRVVVATAFDLYLIDPDTGKSLRRFRGHGCEHVAVAPSPDGRLFAVAASDQTISLWHPEREQPLLSLFCTDQDWVAWTDEGYYAASANGEWLAGWLINHSVEEPASYYPAAQFRKSLYQPQVIRRVVAAGNVARALERAGKPPAEALTVTEVLPPVVAITAPAGLGDIRLDRRQFTVRAAARSVGRHPVTALRLLIDGRPYQGPAGLREIVQPKLGEVQASWDVEVSPGRHVLAVLAESAVSRAQSPTVDVLVAGTPAERPALYALAVGISRYEGPLRLNYAAADADALARVLQTRSGRLYRQVEVKVLKDRKATRQGIEDGLAWLGTRMTAQDVGVLFFSGHGSRDPQGRFYLVPVDANARDPAASCIAGDYLTGKLAAMPGRLITMLDACHSGAATESARAERAAADDLVRDLIGEENGVIVMSSSLGREFSLESSEVKQGFFTLALTEGLAGSADLNRDGAVFLSELDRYAARRVQVLSRGLQNPVMARPPTVRAFPLTEP